MKRTLEGKDALSALTLLSFAAAPVEDKKRRQKCRLDGCQEPACGSRAGFCASHAYGPRRCEFPGCTKCAQGGARKFCISHGGGRRCQHPGCTKGARDRFFCAAHGGGRRCQEPGCTKGAVGGTDKCTAHGGGRRCQSSGCPRSAQSGTHFCVCHGGGRTCRVDKCSRVARGRSQFCASHRSAQACPHCDKYSMNYNGLCDDHQPKLEKSQSGIIDLRRLAPQVPKFLWNPYPLYPMPVVDPNLLTSVPAPAAVQIPPPQVTGASTTTLSGSPPPSQHPNNYHRVFSR
ncbi:hypothetical protein CTAYLR_002628 [Chrysophaeum taylorii]|uniref:WRKY19-like zinc finger domain-containing protein n=1 Tax=Chrysophaeum taylorii TaxID=2483200 RepID=A0AAD7UDA3_9STRA|nr:hypothetical protein CTAYLR_002628 [Chrysophaeum taylorii]